ncbi:hypothetical protein F2Q70_00030726 [Brassica cretica]|uniref:Uncharacterized protein n=2 Tax=Brassica cretica TaxID=69181 RepID=A0A8S9FGU3_BRACR|nr:hypothetical protein F2Q70_00030726 [Brassica cretica]KAF2554090.1 hypothetical protein F2Q68_00035133 [Brassica cretica]KAF3598104.1 hypothetical protein DY000_02023374 [Brassica cretica]
MYKVLERRRCLFSGGENTRSVKASAGRSSEGMEKRDSTGGGGARQFAGPVMEDEVVKLSPHARAIRDVEDEELRSFFFGMSPWQFDSIFLDNTRENHQLL